jgi:hypothetical protein
VELDEKREVGLLKGKDVHVWKTMFGDLSRHLKAKNGILVQRSWSKWLKNGDVNLKFFSQMCQ